MHAARSFLALASLFGATLVPTAAYAANEPSEIAESAPPAPAARPSWTPDVWIVPGILFTSASSDPGPDGEDRRLVRGLGGQLSVLSVDRKAGEAMGAFGQASSYDGRYLRWAAGVEVTTLSNLMRMALAYDARAAHDAFAHTHGIHVSAGLDLVFVGLGLRTSIPVAKSGDGEKQHFELAAELTAKVPLGDYRKW